MHSKVKTLIKSLLYRAYSEGIFFIVVLIFTGDVQFSSGISLLSVIFKTITYYSYEIFYKKVKNYKRKK